MPTTAPGSVASPSSRTAPVAVDAATTWQRACLNCGSALVGPFCAECGQRAVPPNPSLRELAGDAFAEFSGGTASFAETIRALLFRPGQADARVSRGAAGAVHLAAAALPRGEPRLLRAVRGDAGDSDEQGRRSDTIAGSDVRPFRATSNTAESRLRHGCDRPQARHGQDRRCAADLSAAPPAQRRGPGRISAGSLQLAAEGAVRAAAGIRGHSQAALSGRADTPSICTSRCTSTRSGSPR